MRYTALVFLSFLSVAYGGWLFVSVCGHPELGGSAANGDCVPLDKNNTYYRKIDCHGDTAIESICWDPLCANCKENDKTRLDTCDDGMTATCFDSDINYSRIVGKHYALFTQFRESNCSSAIVEEAAYPTNVCISIPGRGSSLATCSKGNNSVTVMIFVDDSCGSRVDTYTLPLGQCTDSIGYATCYGM